MAAQMQGLSVKGTAGVLGGAISSLGWTLAAAFIPEVNEKLSPEELLAVNGSTSIILGVILFYRIKESAAVVFDEPPTD